MEMYRVVPDAIGFVPDDVVNIEFGKNIVNMGTVITPTQVHNQRPSAISWPVKSSRLYTLLMTDIWPIEKIPEDPFHHWLVVNIPGCEIEKGDTLIDYLGIAPVKGYGYHRYVFLVYEQSERIKHNEEYISSTCPDGREGESIADIAKKYNLGKPMAANFLLSEYDEFCDVIVRMVGLEPVQ
ncbi:protein D3-like [Ptychodera flava]|uniref:protein D3-like n=1 Tax=Ptychodera flava TaxID=63121 RepID=UPI00396AAC38